MVRDAAAAAAAAFRAEVPALHQTVHGRPLTYLDSASTLAASSIRASGAPMHTWMPPPKPMC